MVGDVTSNLEGDLFIDDAATGGSDVTIGEGNFTPIGIRTFDYGAGQAGTLTISGFGFATSAVADANDATSIDLQFVYMGADNTFNTADDFEIGTVNDISYTHTGAGEYYVNFGENSISAAIDGVGDQFRVLVNVDDTNLSLAENIRFKSNGGSKISVSGSFTPVPEPGTTALGMGLVAVGFLMVRRIRNRRSSVQA